MARRVSTKLVALAPALTLALASSLALAAPATIVSYDFDDGLLQSGPDTFRVFRNNLHTAALSYELAHSGTASVHFKDPAGDGDFVEFQGYIERQDSGVLSLGFSFLITGDGNSFSVALAGDEGYKLRNHGINFWLTYDGDWLRNYSNSIPKKVLQPLAFQWYSVRADLDFDSGTQNLLITDEYGEAVYQAEKQLLAPGKHETHTVREYSIVGDIYDRSPSDFFIDSFYITSSTNLPRTMVAPGRRKLFVDRWNDYQATVQGDLRCLPAINLIDLGIDERDLGEIFSDKQMDDLLLLTADIWADPGAALLNLHPRLQAVAHWRRACVLLAQGKAEGAADPIKKALAISPGAYIYRLSDLIIRSEGLEPGQLLVQMADLRTGEIRSEVALAMMAVRYNLKPQANGFYPPDLSTGFTLRAPGLKPEHKSVMVHSPSPLAIQKMKSFMPDDWEAWLAWSVAMEFQYMAMLGTGSYAQAQSLAAEVAQVYSEFDLPVGLWRERMGDTALLLDQPQLAIGYYEGLRNYSYPGRVELKLSDAYFMLGNYEEERELRESIYHNFTQE